MKKQRYISIKEVVCKMEFMKCGEQIGLPLDASNGMLQSRVVFICISHNPQSRLASSTMQWN